jgi:hypothetical protein
MPIAAMSEPGWISQSVLILESDSIRELRWEGRTSGNIDSGSKVKDAVRLTGHSNKLGIVSEAAG